MTVEEAVEVWRNEGDPNDACRIAADHAGFALKKQLIRRCASPDTLERVSERWRQQP